MAGVADAARFFSEQSLPELRELERQGIFTTDEVKAIAKKRSTFEYRILGSGAKASDFARYVEFEMNFEFLRLKRAKRCGLKKTKKSASHSQWRTMSIMERAVRKFPTDMTLWMQYTELARKQKAFKKVSKVLTNMVRLNAKLPGAWIYAAAYAMGDLGDMQKARGFMQRGLRMCDTSQEIRLEYMKLELSYLAKIYSRQRILGLEEDSEVLALPQQEDGEDDDVIKLPTVTAGELDDEATAITENAVMDHQTLRKTPALMGAIPLAIFKESMNTWKDEELGGKFYDLAATFHALPCITSILQQMTEFLTQNFPNTATSIDAAIRLPLIGVPSSSPAFPQLLSEALHKLEASLSANSAVALELAPKSLAWLTVYLVEDLDPDIREVITVTCSRLLDRYRKILELDANPHNGDKFALLVESFKGTGLAAVADQQASQALRHWPLNHQLQAISGEKVEG